MTRKRKSRRTATSGKQRFVVNGINETVSQLDNTTQDAPRQAVFNFCCNDCAKRAKALLKKYRIRMKIRGCDALCRFPHVGHINAPAAKVEQIFSVNNFDGDYEVIA